MQCAKLLFWCIPAVLVCAETANPIKVTMTGAPNGVVKVLIENDSTTNLTAVAFSEPGHAYPYLNDAATRQWHEVEPGKQTIIGFNLTLPAPLEFKAAVLADGETFGDTGMIEMILAKRRAMLQALGIVLQHLPLAGNGATAPTPLLPLFRSYKAEQLKGLSNDDPVRTAIINANLLMERKMQALTGESSDAIITAVVAMLRDWQTSLSHSLPSLSAAR